MVSLTLSKNNKWKSRLVHTINLLWQTCTLVK